MKANNFRLAIFGLAAISVVACTDTTISESNQDEISEDQEARNIGLEFIQNDSALEQGEKIAKTSFESISGALMQAMAKGGVSEAMTYCNISALPITDSLSESQKVEIQRLAINYRNPMNKAIDIDFDVMQYFQNQLVAGNKPISVLLQDKDALVFFKPILLMPQCLGCHGNPETEILPETKELLMTYYPDDLATGFKVGDLRGMWKIKL